MTEDARRSIHNPPGIRVGAAPTIRVAAKAIIIRDDHLLVTANTGKDMATFYLCPGGGQDHGEDARTALRRECREEVGCEVVVGEFAFLRDYIGADHEFAEYDGWAHQLEAYFFCELSPGSDPRLTSAADTWQTGVAWLPLSDLAGAPLWPRALARWLATAETDRPRYLGNVN